MSNVTLRIHIIYACELRNARRARQYPISCKKAVQDKSPVEFTRTSPPQQLLARTGTSTSSRHASHPGTPPSCLLDHLIDTA